MKIIKYFLFTVICFQFGFSQTGSIKGQLHDTIENKGFGYALVIINDLNKGAQADQNGNFKIEKIPIGKYSIKISNLGNLDKEIQEVEVYKDSTTILNINYPPFCKYYNSNKECPICKKEDKVIPIIYGLPSNKMAKKAEKGKMILAGCEITGCDPNWYCKRDEIEF